MNIPADQGRRKQMLRDVIARRFEGKARWAARALSAATGDNIHEQTLHKWKAPDTASTARACPGWVLFILERCPTEHG